jgi:hypothetical protein
MSRAPRQDMKAIVWVAGGVLIGCSESPTEVSPDELHSGVYALQITKSVDSCDPPRVTGDAGRVAVSVSEQGIGAFEPIELKLATGYQQYELAADAGYTRSSGAGIDASSLCGGHSTFLIDRHLTSATSAGFVVAKTTDWTVTVACPGDVVSEAPAASCHSVQDLRYQLVTVCDAPCQLRSERIGEFTCACPAS